MDFPDVDTLGLGAGRGVAPPWSTHDPEVDKCINQAGKTKHVSGRQSRFPHPEFESLQRHGSYNHLQ